MFQTTDTISAIATPPGEGGIGIVRVSGKQALPIARRLFTPLPQRLQSHRTYVGSVIDPSTGELTDAYDVIAPWEGPVEWQDPHPAIQVSGDVAYVTEPAANSVHAVDLTTGEAVASTELDVTPNEIAPAAGRKII